MRFPLILTVIEALFEAITCNLTMCGCIIMILHEKKNAVVIAQTGASLCASVPSCNLF